MWRVAAGQEVGLRSDAFAKTLVCLRILAGCPVSGQSKYRRFDLCKLFLGDYCGDYVIPRGSFFQVRVCRPVTATGCKRLRIEWVIYRGIEGRELTEGQLMKVLITGGVGTISRFITDDLARAGHEVVLLNHHQKDVGGFSNISVVVCDRRNYPEFVKTCREIGPFDCVFDMISFTTDDAASSIEAFRHNTGQLVYCSTVDVYTKPGSHYPVREDSERKPSPSFPYAFQKALSEELLMEAERRGDFNLTIMRPGHTYAEESARSHLLFHAFKAAPGASYHLDRIKKGKPIIMHGDGMSVWTITHGIDVGRAFAAALVNKRAFGKAYTIAGDECMSYRKYWDAVAEVMGAPPIRYVYIPSELLGRLQPERAMLGVENFMFNNIFDNSAAKNDLGFEQTVTWPEGIRRCLDAFEATGGFDDSDKPEYAFYDRIVAEYTKLCDLLVTNVGDRAE